MGAESKLEDEVLPVFVLFSAVATHQCTNEHCKVGAFMGTCKAFPFLLQALAKSSSMGMYPEQVGCHSHMPPPQGEQGTSLLTLRAVRVARRATQAGAPLQASASLSAGQGGRCCLSQTHLAGL